MAMQLGSQQPASLAQHSLPDVSGAEDRVSKARARLQEYWGAFAFSVEVFTQSSIKATFSNDLKFELLELTSLDFTEKTAAPLETKPEGKKKGSKRAVAPPKKLPQSIPETAVNEYGIAPKTLRILEMTDMCTKMNDVIRYSAYTKQGAIESLATLAQQQLEKQAVLRTRQLSIQSNSPNLVNNFATPMVPQMPHQSATNAMMGTGIGAAQAQAQMRASASPRSMKRRTSVAISPSESGHVASPIASPAMGNQLVGSMLGAGTPTLGHAMMSGAPSTTTLTPGMGLGPGVNIVGSPQQTPATSMTSPIFTPMTAVGISSAVASTSGKSNKRVRTASATSALAVTGVGGSKGSSSSAANGIGQGRSRKGTGRKESNAKRKSSIAEDARKEALSLGGVAVAGLQEKVPMVTTGGGMHAPGPLVAAGAVPGAAGMLHRTAPYPSAMASNTALSNALNKARGGSNAIHAFVNGANSVMAGTNGINSQDGSNGYFPALMQPQVSMQPGIYTTVGPQGVQHFSNMGADGSTMGMQTTILGQGYGQGQVQVQVPGGTTSMDSMTVVQPNTVLMESLGVNHASG
ncbi:hypothetical protein BGZ58_007702 [Dissophora ornata]|nr:hypothetical protein BGZ58_007702 [Dissophora ornata]